MSLLQEVVNPERIAEIVIICPDCGTERRFKVDLESEAWFMLCNYGKHNCEKCEKEYSIEGSIDYEKSVFPKVNN